MQKKGFKLIKSETLDFVVGETMPESNEIIKDLAKIEHVKFL